MISGLNRTAFGVRKRGSGSGTGPILLSQATFLLAHIANSGPVPLSAPPAFRSSGAKPKHGRILEQAPKFLLGYAITATKQYSLGWHLRSPRFHPLPTQKKTGPTKAGTDFSNCSLSLSKKSSKFGFAGSSTAGIIGVGSFLVEKKNRHQ